MSTYPYSVCLDSKVELTGVYSNPTTTWTIPFSDDGFTTTSTVIVKSDQFSGGGGGLITVASVTVGASSIAVTATGDYSAGPCIIGKRYMSLFDAPRFMLRNDRSVGDLSKFVDLIELYIQLQDTGYLKMRRAIQNRTDYTPTLNPTAPAMYSEPLWTTRPNGYIGDMTLTFESDDPRPFVVTGIQPLVKWEQR